MQAQFSILFVTAPPKRVRGLTPRSVSERFWEKVSRSDSANGCWLWTANRDRKGYGKMGGGGRLGPTLAAHRVSWELHFGLIPNGLFVLHHCDNPPCVNPSHLFLGTMLDNNHDMWEKGRGMFGDRHGLRLHPERVARGERQGGAKLTENQVREIRQRYAAGGLSMKQLADEYGVTFSPVQKIISGSGWRHLL